MSTHPLTQRLYDKTKSDLSAFRDEIAHRLVEQAESGFSFSGSAVDLFWQNSRIHLERKVSEYFEWIERESDGIVPANLRYVAIDQCVGAVVTYARQARKATIEKHRVLQKLASDVDHGNWTGIDDNSITERGRKLSLALGLGPQAPVSSKLNHFVNDQKWLPMLLSVISLVISLAAFFRK